MRFVSSAHDSLCRLPLRNIVLSSVPNCGLYRLLTTCLLGHLKKLIISIIVDQEQDILYREPLLRDKEVFPGANDVMPPNFNERLCACAYHHFRFFRDTKVATPVLRNQMTSCRRTLTKDFAHAHIVAFGLSVTLRWRRLDSSDV